MVLRRRMLLATAGLALARSKGLFANSAPPIIGVVVVGPHSSSLRAAFIRGLHQAGLAEGRDFEMAYCVAGDEQNATAPAVDELLRRHPAVIIAQSTPLTLALKRASDSTPIISIAMTDPIRLGLIQSIAHPGGNVTGLLAGASTRGKQLELLLQVVPSVRRVGVLNNPGNPGNTIGMHTLKEEVSGTSISLNEVEAGISAELEPAFRRLTSADVGALLVAQDALFIREAKSIAALALAARLPTINGFRVFAEAGGLMSYGSSSSDRWMRAGEYAAKILRGEKPGDLPVQQQPKLELVVNMKTAKLLGLTMPPIVLARADDLIE